MSTFKTLFFAITFLALGVSCTGGNAKTKADRVEWHLSIQSYTFHLFSVVESLDKTRELGVGFIEIYPGQKMGEGFGEAVFGYQLDPDQQRKLKEEAKTRNVKIVSSGVWTAQRAEWENNLSQIRRSIDYFNQVIEETH